MLMENKNPPRKALFQILPTKIKSKVISIPTQQEVAGARRGGRTGEMNSSESSAFRALRVAVTPDNKGKYSEQGIALINIQCFFLFIFIFLVVAAASRAVNP